MVVHHTQVERDRTNEEDRHPVRSVTFEGIALSEALQHFDLSSIPTEALANELDSRTKDGCDETDPTQSSEIGHAEEPLDSKLHRLALLEATKKLADMVLSYRCYESDEVKLHMLAVIFE